MVILKECNFLGVPCFRIVKSEPTILTDILTSLASQGNINKDVLDHSEDCFTVNSLIQL